MTRTSSLEVSIKTYIECILYTDCSICFTIVHMVAFVNLILKKMMKWMNDEWECKNAKKCYILRIILHRNLRNCPTSCRRNAYISRCWGQSSSTARWLNTTLSQNMLQLWNGIAQNYKDRFLMTFCRNTDRFNFKVGAYLTHSVWDLYLQQDIARLSSKMVNGFRYYRALESVSIALALSTALTIYPCQIRVH